MKKTAMFLTLLLTGCAVDSSVIYLEIEDMEPITSKTVAEMSDCMDYGNKEACAKAKELFDRHPWQKEGNFDGVRIDNSNAMRQNEWDLSITTIRKNLQKMKKMYPQFVVDEYNYRTQ